MSATAQTSAREDRTTSLLAGLSAEARAARLRDHHRRAKAAVHVVDQQPGAPVRHAERAAGLGDRAGFSDGFQQPDLAGAERAIRSGATGRILRLPSDVTVDAALASRCADREAGRTIDFFPSGMSCGGTIALARPGMGYEIRVNWLTGGVEIVQKQKLL